MLDCRLQAQGHGGLALFVTDGQAEFLIEIDPASRRGTLLRDDAQVAAADDVPRLDLKPVRLELALVDRQVLLSIAGRPVFAYAYEPSDRPARPTPRPLAIGSQGLGIELSAIKVYRDVYYTPPRADLGRLALGRAARARQYRLGGDEYFVLGDNSPLSLDSRDWAAGPGVPVRLLLGKPFFVYFPSRATSWRGFHVPDLAAIRYIR